MRATWLVGLPAFSVDTGRRLGRVHDLLVADGGDRVAGLLITPPGWRQPPFRVGWAQVRSAGRDAVMVAEPLAPGEGIALHRLVDRTVLNPAGMALGYLADVWLDRASGHLRGIQLGQGMCEDLLQGQPVVPVTAPLGIASDVILWRSGGGSG